jgi:hypothetical protein
MASPVSFGKSKGSAVLAQSINGESSPSKLMADG